MSGGTAMETLVVGSGIAGLSAAIRAAELGHHVTQASPYVSERAQSVMAAGGINAALDTLGEGDTPALHAAETLAAGRNLEDPRSVRALCDAAPDVVRWLERLGVVF
ncbi:MAG: FAD-binding protein, partial [Olsenella sp.]|nr:FAD-binding protein [Olsenella sp.]